MTNSDRLMHRKGFCLSLTRLRIINGWREESVLGCFLYLPASVPLVRVTSAGVDVCIVVGWAATNGKLLPPNGSIAIERSGLDKVIESLCGRYVTITLDSDGGVAVRTDAGGLFPVVFDEKAMLVSSSAAVIGLYRKLDRGGMAASISRSDSTIWYPFGVTPFIGLRRLLPSECLEFSARACVPVLNGPILPSSDARVSSAELCEEVALAASSFASKSAIAAHLTGGYDSRMVMAAIIRTGLPASFLTIRMNSQAAHLDVYLARRLAKKVGVGHRVIDFLAPTAQEVTEWRERVGDCFYDSVTQMCRTVRENDTGEFVLTGACGEVGRGFYWKREDIGSEGMRPRELVERLGFRPSEHLEELAARWLDRFPAYTKTTLLLDNAYIDLRLGCWAGASMPGHDIDLPTISPFNSHLTYRAMLALDEEYRFSQKFATDFIGAGAAALLSEPFNQARGVARLKFWRSELKRVLPKPLTRMLRNAFSQK